MIGLKQVKGLWNKIEFLLFKLFFAASFAFCGNLQAKTVEYDLKMSLKVPRVYDNSDSLGKRKYQTQKIRGRIVLKYADESSEPSVSVIDLKNSTHKVGGNCVTYSTRVVECPIWHVIGSNRTGKFKVPSVSIRIDADPSYNIGEDEPDNALILTLSGNGTMKRIRGFAAGQIGCGCRMYGHVSPTRIMFTDTVVDTASVHGRWSAKFKKESK